MKIKKTILAMLIAISIISSFTACTTVKKKDPNYLGDFDPQSIGKLMAGTVTRVKKQIKPTELKFVFFPRTNIMEIHFRNKTTIDNVWICLDQKDRETISAGINQFLKEYEEQTLSVENNKKKALFGKTEISLAWGLFGATRSTNPTLRCEYELLTKNRPYFILGNAMKGDGKGANCPALRIALSPAQCDDMLRVLDQKNLLKIVESLQSKFEKYDIEKPEGEKKEPKKDSGINYN